MKKSAWKAGFRKYACQIRRCKILVSRTLVLNGSRYLTVFSLSFFASAPSLGSLGSLGSLARNLCRDNARVSSPFRGGISFRRDIKGTNGRGGRRKGRKAKEDGGGQAYLGGKTGENCCPPLSLPLHSQPAELNVTGRKSHAKQSDKRAARRKREREREREREMRVHRGATHARSSYTRGGDRVASSIP